MKEGKVMKVAFMLGSLNRGGAETLALDVCKNVSNFNLNLSYIYRKDGLLKESFLKTNVRAKKIAPKSKIDIFYLLKLRKYFIEEKITIIHAHQLIDALYALLASVFLPIKLVITFHGHARTINRRDWIVGILRKFIMKKSDMNIFVSDWLLKYYIEHYNDRFNFNRIVLYNGISFNKFNVKESVSDVRKELHIDNDKLLLGSIGNFTSVRDQLTTCRFLKLLANEGVDFTFVFVGAKSESEPWLYERCKVLCSSDELKDKVIFMGSRSDVPSILKQLDAFIYSTSFDSFGIAVVEAMYMAIPVFTNDWHAMLEITDSGEYASIYMTKNENDLLEKFKIFLLNKDLYLNRAKLASDYVKSNYSIEKHLTDLKKCYESLNTDS